MSLFQRSKMQKSGMAISEMHGIKIMGAMTMPLIIRVTKVVTSTTVFEAELLDGIGWALGSGGVTLDDIFNDRFVIVVLKSTSAANIGAIRKVTDYAVTDGKLTTVAMPATNTVGDEFQLIPVWMLNDVFVTDSTVVSSGIPNATQVAGAITAAAVGDVLVEEILFATDDTGLAAPTNIEISTDNALGHTGADVPVLTEIIASFGANLNVSKKDATSHAFPFILESGKKVYIHGDNAAGTGAGEANIKLVCRRIDGSSLVGADIAAA